MAKTNKIVYVTKAQYSALISNGSVTVGGTTYTYDANNTYMVREDGLEGTAVQSTGATSGQVLTADGNGGASWTTAGGGSGNVTASGTLSVGSVVLGLGGKSVTAASGTNGKFLGWNGGATWQDPPKVYQHKISIEATDTNNESCYVQYIIYNTNANSLFTSPTPTINDVMNVIQATCIGSTPPTYNSNKFFRMSVNVWEESLNVTIIDVATGTISGLGVRSIQSATDAVMQM